MTYPGALMREMVGGAIKIIQQHAHDLTPKWKLGYGQKEGDIPDDYATEGDLAAQEYYRQLIVTDPACAGFGIIAEEGLAIPCTHEVHDVYFTIDPLDGTKAYNRGQSHEVGTMIALVVDGVVVAAYVGDVNTGEVYGYTRQIGEENKFIFPPTRYRFGHELPMANKELVVLAKRYLHFRESPVKTGRICQAMLGEVEGTPGLFKDLTVDGGSIGICMGRLWNSTVGAVVMITSAHETPWDRTPIIGINEALGFKTLRFMADGTYEVVPLLPSKVLLRCAVGTFDMIIHQDNIPELDKWIAAYR